MSLFIPPRDFEFFKGINKELIGKIIDTYFTLYQVNVAVSENNLYGEDKNKTYFPGIKINGFINKHGTDAEETELGTNVKQLLDLGVAIADLLELKVLPEVGDIVEWNNNYYEIHNTNENHFIANRPEYSYTMMLNCHVTNVGFINIGTRE
jgi:hypothetical protein